MAFLRGCYHQVLEPFHLPQFADILCRYFNVCVYFHRHLVGQTTESQLERARQGPESEHIVTDLLSYFFSETTPGCARDRPRPVQAWGRVELA